MYSNYSSSYFTPSKSPNVNCKLHKKEFLVVDTLKFKVHCAKCLEKGEKNINLEIVTSTELEDSSSESEEDTVECYAHPNSKGIFYCDDCQEYLCKLCFANEHRTHNSNLPSDIARNYLLKLKGIMENISQIKPKIEESLKSITEIDKKIKSIRETSVGRMKELVSKISAIIKTKSDDFIHQFYATFEGMDIEVDNVVKRLEAFQKKAVKSMSDINEVIYQLNSKTSNSKSLTNSIEICMFKKSKQVIVDDVKKMLEDSKNFLQYKLENTKIKGLSKIEAFNKQNEKYFKQLSIYEKSIMNSISTGISSSSLRLRRFSKFFKKHYEYYKSSSIICKTSAPICLVGLGICGLYPQLNKSKENSSNSTDIKTIPLLVQISEFKVSEENSKKNEPMLVESHTLGLISNPTDPTVLLYLNKAIILKPDTKYMITVTNLHKDSFLELWCGEVAKVFREKSHQIVLCNTSLVNFEFFPSQGVESDFNEFTVGIIADLIFSTTGK